MNLENEVLRKDQTDKTGLVFHIPKSLLQVKSLTEAKINRIAEVESKPDVIPFLELKIINASEVYRIAKSYIKDLEHGRKSFGFVSLNVKENDKNMTAIASCLSYSRNNSPVLLIVKDLSSHEWTKWSSHFSAGTLGPWKTCEWGHLCLIDYHELASTATGNSIDFKLLYSEFDAIFWSMPKLTSETMLKGKSIDVLRSLDSIALSIRPVDVTASEVKAVEQHYKSLGIPLKGILHEGGTK